MKLTTRIVVCAVALGPAAADAADHGGPGDYLSRDRYLKATLILRDTGGFAGAGTGRKWVVEPSGKWLRVTPVDGKRVETRGELSKEQLRDLAKELARFDLLHLPKEVNTMTVADGINVLIEFGDRRSTFYGKVGFRDLPEPGAGTPPGRFAGVARAIQAALREPASHPAPRRPCPCGTPATRKPPAAGSGPAPSGTTRRPGAG